METFPHTETVNNVNRRWNSGRFNYTIRKSSKSFESTSWLKYNCQERKIIVTAHVRTILEYWGANNLNWSMDFNWMTGHFFSGPYISLKEFGMSIDFHWPNHKNWYEIDQTVTKTWQTVQGIDQVMSKASISSQSLSLSQMRERIPLVNVRRIEKSIPLTIRSSESSREPTLNLFCNSVLK
jgi:hypothetical protein